MNRNEFYNIVKAEKLDNYNIGDSQEATKMANIIGCAHNDAWIVYETDERGLFRSISEHGSEEDGGHIKSYQT